MNPDRISMKCEKCQIVQPLKSFVHVKNGIGLYPMCTNCYLIYKTIMANPADKVENADLLVPLSEKYKRG